jgi:hypothetical protein
MPKLPPEILAKLAPPAGGKAWLWIVLGVAAAGVGAVIYFRSR